MRLAALVAVPVLLVSCAGPKIYQFENSWETQATFDDAWSATVQVFAERQWSIQTLEKDSGIIVSEWLGIERDKSYCDCGSSGLSVVRGREVKFNVFINNDGDPPRITINAKFREHRMFDYQTYTVACNSKGAVEQLVSNHIFEKIRAKNSGGGNQ